MFDLLSNRIQDVFDKLRGRDKLTPEMVDEGLKEIRLALLEADVHFQVVKDFLAKVRQEATGEKVLKNLNPAQQIVKVVRDEMVHLLGDEAQPLNVKKGFFNQVLMVGLQGSGKTTTAAKLALKLKEDGHIPLLVAGDIYRPAAIDQLISVGEKAGVQVFTREHENQQPLEIYKAAVAKARKEGFTVLIMDTAGRLTIDEAMMEEVKGIKQAGTWNEVLLVIDAMTGQDAVNTAEAFAKQVGVTGAILTKLDGDARGGAALSVRAVTGVPIKYFGTAEHLEGLEVFHPDRLVGRILGMGDVLSLIEKVEREVDEQQAKEMHKKIMSQTFNYEDFLDQLKQIKKLGSIDQIIRLLPGMQRAMGDALSNIRGDELTRVECIIQSMTLKERRDPDLLRNSGSRKRRVAAGAGVTIGEVNALIKQFHQSRTMMKQLTSMQRRFEKKGFGIGGLNMKDMDLAGLTPDDLAKMAPE
ncbi:MAG TPA: signal recognition particle protein, partial [bacterium]|nr:signal recognition particle protein [bacterium]